MEAWPSQQYMYGIIYLIGTELVVNIDLVFAYSGKHKVTVTVSQNRTI